MTGHPTLGLESSLDSGRCRLITTADLKAQTRRELADLARNYGVAGWHGLKKDELVEEIRKVQQRLRRKASAESRTVKSGGKSSRSATPSRQETNGKAQSRKTTSSRDDKRLRKRKADSQVEGPLHHLDAQHGVSRITQVGDPHPDEASAEASGAKGFRKDGAYSRTDSQASTDTAA